MKKKEVNYREGRKAKEEGRERRGRLRQKVGETGIGKIGRKWGAATSWLRLEEGQVWLERWCHCKHSSVSKKVSRGADFVTWEVSKPAWSPKGPAPLWA